MLAGMALGVSGLLMQTYFRNPLAEPFVLGVSSGASLGVALVVLTAGAGGGALLAGLGLAGDLLLTAAAGLGAAFTMALVMLVALRVQSSVTLLILGLMFGYLVSALVSLLLYFALPERIQAYINWTFGSFSGVTAAQLPILALIVAAGLLLSAALVKPLNALLLGEDYALSLGMHPTLTRFGIVLATALLVSAVTAFCGPIAFIGIAVPHLCRGLLGSADHRLLLPGTMLTGACIALCASIIAEMPGNNLVLPLNVVTALSGRAGGDARGSAQSPGDLMTLPALETRALSIGYTRRGRPDNVLAQGLNLSLRRGQLIGLLGPNGIGKSTLLRTPGGHAAADRGPGPAGGRRPFSLQSKRAGAGASASS